MDISFETYRLQSQFHIWSLSINWAIQMVDKENIVSTGMMPYFLKEQQTRQGMVVMWSLLITLMASSLRVVIINAISHLENSPL